jgi:4-amino-4-deoxy-L-arabinose transferase-like glycosyltransferase
MIRLLLPALTLLAAFWAARSVSSSELGDRIEHMESWIRRFGPLAAAVVAAAAVWWTWGDLRPPPVVHDESSYVLQAEIFARFAWTAPTPPIPEFFEQPHVLLVPAVASKYPPGHALLLAIGSLLRFNPLMPLLLTAATSALLMLVATRISNAWVALITWIVWLTTPLVLRFQPGYFSEMTTTALVLASWWCLLEWRETRRRGWMLLMALAIGWGAITRPVTMLAFAIPIGVLVVWDVARARTRQPWLDLGLAFVVGCVVLLILPLWSARTTGDRGLTPIALYTRDYLPFDKPGFTTDTSPPKRPLSPVVKSLYDDFRAHRERQSLSNLPRTVAERFASIAGDLFRGTQLILIPFFAIGLVFMSKELRLALISVGVLFVFYLPYAHDAPWTLYYLEIAPAIAAITASGIWHALVRVVRGVVIQRHVDRRPKLGSALVAIVLATFAIPTLAYWRLQHKETSGARVAFEQAVAQLPSSKSIIFVRYANRPHHLSLVYNSPDPQTAPVWVVHDLGERNKELVHLALDRTAYVFDEGAMEFRRF